MKERDGYLYWNIQGQITCSLHAPVPGSDTWVWEGWERIPLDIAEANALVCETCRFAPSTAPEGKGSSREAPRPIRPLTKILYHALLSDVWPEGSAAIVDFGLESQEHYEALYYPLRAGEISLHDLDAALGSGPKLTALVQSAGSNPHKGIVFRTPYDELL